ncbi:MAG: hypothetical protein KAJ00_04040 [Deltaproteobacteria bacterium]|nr:hypothetical protein [Deltaproteobacteria bacterium]
MKRLFETFILVLFALAVLFHSSHLYYDQGDDLSSNQSYMSQYSETMPDVVLDPITNIPY